MLYARPVLAIASAGDNFQLMGDIQSQVELNRN